MFVHGQAVKGSRQTRDTQTKEKLEVLKRAYKVEPSNVKARFLLCNDPPLPPHTHTRAHTHLQEEKRGGEGGRIAGVRERRREEKEEEERKGGEGRGEGREGKGEESRGGERIREAEEKDLSSNGHMLFFL